MKQVLVTGATGTLGKEVVAGLLRAGHGVRAVSRKAFGTDSSAGLEWVTADLATGEGLAESVAGADCIVHCATSPVRRPRAVDAQGTRLLLHEAKRHQIEHFIYPSIIGIDRVRYPYYRHKLSAERAVVESGLPYSILRASKFHPFIDGILSALSRLPVMLVPTDFEDQPVDVGEVADRLAARATSGPGGMLPELAGPEILSHRELAEQWMAARNVRKRILHLPIPGQAARAFREGATTNPAAERGRVTWAQWLENRSSGCRH